VHNCEPRTGFTTKLFAIYSSVNTYSYNDIRKRDTRRRRMPFARYLIRRVFRSSPVVFSKISKTSTQNAVDKTADTFGYRNHLSVALLFDTYARPSRPRLIYLGTPTRSGVFTSGTPRQLSTRTVVVRVTGSPEFVLFRSDVVRDFNPPPS